MGLEPINVELTDFNKLELLRDEEESLTEKLAEVEKSIRDGMLAAARREFLMSLSPYYASVAAGEVDVAKLRELESQRQLIGSALEVVKAQYEQFEQALGAADQGAKRPGRRSPRPKGAAGARSSSFDSFENFRQTRG